MKYFWFIVGFVLIFGSGVAACTAVARALHGQNPLHQGMDWVNGKARQAERDRSVAGWIDRHGGDSRSMRPAPTQAQPTPTVKKPSSARTVPAKSKKK